MKSVKYNYFSKLIFYGSYFWYKLILPLEVKSPRFRLWMYELAYTAHKFRDYAYCMPWRYPVDVITTRFGSFRIRRNTADAANVSPAFERRDLNHLFRRIRDLTRSGKRVLFLDVGGDIGTYSIAVSNRFNAEMVSTVCFEPIPASCALILDNIERNRLKGRIELMEVALMDEPTDRLNIRLNPMAPGSSGVTGDGEEVFVQACRLDERLAGRPDDFDAVVLKIDVEGAEERVLRGASGLFAQGIEAYLMVEDFIDQSIVTYLEDHGWSFERKLTEYNSWWIKN